MNKNAYCVYGDDELKVRKFIHFKDEFIERTNAPFIGYGLCRIIDQTDPHTSATIFFKKIIIEMIEFGYTEDELAYYNDAVALKRKSPGWSYDIIETKNPYRINEKKQTEPVEFVANLLGTIKTKVGK